MRTRATPRHESLVCTHANTRIFKVGAPDPPGGNSCDNSSVANLLHTSVHTALHTCLFASMRAHTHALSRTRFHAHALHALNVLKEVWCDRKLR